MPASPPLSKQLRAETEAAHRLAEGTRFAKAFFRGELPQRLYAESLAQLLPVYAAMEDALRRAHAGELPGGERLVPFHLPEVFREAALRADLAHFGVSPEPRGGAARRYRERIEAVVAAEPVLLVAHAYVRYMGDVSGGAIAAKVAERVLQLPSRKGLAFLDHDDIESPSAFRDDFRARLDALPLSEAEREAMLREASAAFDFNREMVEELWSEPPPGS